MDTFDPPADQWKTLSPAYLTMKRRMILIVWPLLLLPCCIALGWFWHWWAGAALALPAVGWIAWRWIRMGRVWRVWGYCERGTDLYIREGLMWRRMTVVPYGRMQVVTVNSGPIERRHGLATVTLQTASASTDATIPGLAQHDADALRERLTELGEQQAVGL